MAMNSEGQTTERASTRGVGETVREAARRCSAWGGALWGALRTGGAAFLRRPALAAALRGATRALAAARRRLPGRPALGRGSRRIMRAAAVGALEVAAVWTAGLGLVVRVPAETIGVRAARWGESGIEERDCAAGLHLSVAGWHDWHFLRRGTHLLTFSGDGSDSEAPALDVRTRDGTQARIGVCVPYAIRPGEGHRLVAQGLKASYPRLVRATVEKVLVQQMAGLSAQDLTDTAVRGEWVARNLSELNQAVRPLHVEVGGILFASIAFAPEYEKKLQQTQLMHQTTQLLEASREVAEQEEEVAIRLQQIERSLQEVTHELDLEIDRLRNESTEELARSARESEEYDKTVRLEADQRYAELVSEGNLELYRADAARTQLANEAYSMPGARLYLARRAAQNLRLSRVTLNSSDPDVPNVMDLDRLTDLVLGTRE